MISPQLEVRNLCKSYDEGRIEALRGVDLSIAQGSFSPSADPAAAANPPCCNCWADSTLPPAAKFSLRTRRSTQLSTSTATDPIECRIHLPGVLSAAHAARH